MSSTIPFAVAGSMAAEEWKRKRAAGAPGTRTALDIPAEAYKRATTMTPQERREKGVVGVGLEAAKAGAGEAGRQIAEGGKVAGEVLGTAKEFWFGTGAQPPVKRKQQDEDVAAKTTAATDPQRQETAAPPGQGGTAPKTPEPRPSRDTDYGDVDPTTFGAQGSVLVHSRGGPDPATQPGGFAHPGTREGGELPGFARGVPAEKLAGGATIRRGPESVTGGHSWTLRTPGAQESAYQDARYARAVQTRQAAEDAEMAKLDAAAAQAAAETARSEALAEDPFAPEKAVMAGGIGEERAKTAPEMARMGQAGLLHRAYLENRQSIEGLLAEGKIDQAEADRLLKEERDQYILGIAGFMPGFRIPREDPYAGLYGPGPDEAATD